MNIIPRHITAIDMVDTPIKQDIAQVKKKILDMLTNPPKELTKIIDECYQIVLQCHFTECIAVTRWYTLCSDIVDTNNVYWLEQYGIEVFSVIENAQKYTGDTRFMYYVALALLDIKKCPFPSGAEHVISLLTK